MGLLDQVQSGKTSAPPRMLVYGQEGIGKAQPLHAEVLTPRGFVPMGDIRVGDQVIGADGRAHRVLGISPRVIKPVYTVLLNDGGLTECCDDHLWFTQSLSERRGGQSGAVRTLGEIRKSMAVGETHSIPVTRPVEFTPGDPITVDPWLLGVHLCDISGALEKLENIFRAQRNRAKSIEARDRIVERIETLWESMIALGVTGRKTPNEFIPPRYLRASIPQRLELLRGLIETGGRVLSASTAVFRTFGSQLAFDVEDLVRSLGGLSQIESQREVCDCDVGQVEGPTEFIVQIEFRPDCAPDWRKWFLLDEDRFQGFHRHIKSIDYFGEELCQCIHIDAEDGLYVTDDHILTHNSTLGASAPKPVFIQTEDGLNEIDCHKFPLCRSFAEVVQQLTALANEPHDFQTLALDSLDWLERLVWDQTCADYGVKSIEKVDGGYAKGYVHSLVPWRKVLDLLARLHRDRQMAILLLAHAKVEKFDDPESAPYDRYSPRLHRHAAALFTEWVDAVLFATRKIRTQTSDAGFGRERTIAAPIGRDGGERILRTIGGPACVAKNRYGFPAELPLDWKAVMAALGASSAS